MGGCTSRLMGWISIHAPRVGSDRVVLRGKRILSISIHAPRVGSDGQHAPPLDSYVLFQSTLPVWGATLHS